MCRPTLLVSCFLVVRKTARYLYGIFSVIKDKLISDGLRTAPDLLFLTWDGHRAIVKAI